MSLSDKMKYGVTRAKINYFVHDEKLYSEEDVKLAVKELKDKIAEHCVNEDKPRTHIFLLDSIDEIFGDKLK